MLIQHHLSQGLLDQVRGKIYSIRIEQAYVDWIKRYILHFDKVSASPLDAMR